MLKRLFVVAMALALLVPAARANGVLVLESDQQSVIFLDGEEVGTTPVTLRDIEPGYHAVRFDNPQTGQSKQFQFYSPRKITLEKHLVVEFAKEPMPVAQPVYVQPVAPVVQAPPPPEHKDNTKARMRNVMLGAGLVNEVFNKGKSKGGIRKGVVGAGLLNELINK
ncbi:MAG: PEGA domain-containing protein [Candidatus Riflebacteria bacterium]|nr:PEGA domain-containing protein [Candidatus Riflebacteria bacterium]